MEMIGRYRITGRIGSGSFATVYRGQDDTLDVPVAVKVLADNWSTNDDVRARFLAFRTPQAARWQSWLAERNIITDVRGDVLRIGLGLYHDASDVEQLLEHLRGLG